MSKSNGRALMIPRKKITDNTKIVTSVVKELRTLTTNVTSRAALFRSMLDTIGAHDIDRECGYPHEVTAEMCKELWQRDGIANKIVGIFPSECWTVEPFVFETEKLESKEQTDFENAWNEVYRDLQFYQKLSRLDEVCGIGHYGILLLGFDDGKKLREPVGGINSKSGIPKKKRIPKKLLYIMPFDETTAPIKSFETDTGSRRYGQPRSYNVTINDPSSATGATTGGADSRQQEVHWTRVIHVADNCKTSDVFGQPRLKSVFNRVLDIRKILGSSAEMFWKGGFPGISFEVPPEVAASGEVHLTDEDKRLLKDEIEKYMNSIKRYLSLVGVTAKQLQVNIADPDTHLEVQLMAVCIAIGVPKRIFMGTEEGKLASNQDAESWNKKVLRRQNVQVTPKILRALVDRLIFTGVLPEPDEYKVSWPDVYSVSKADKADIAQKLVRAIAEYIASGAQTFIAPMQFLTMLMDFEPSEAEEILDAAEQFIKDQVAKGVMLDPKEQVEMDKEMKKAEIKQANQPPAAGRVPGAQGSKGGRNSPKKTSKVKK